MFSFIKALQNFLVYLKSRKGLWFGILSVVSTSGIIISMYLLGSMTESIAKDVYVNMSKTYVSKLDGEVSTKQKDLKKLSIALRLNPKFMTSLANPAELNTFMSEYNVYLEVNGFPNTKMYYYPVANQMNQYRTSINNTITRKEPSFGYEIVSDGPSLVYLEPIRVNDVLVGILELRENIFSLKADMERNGSLFLFLVEDKMLPNIAIDHREGRYRPIVLDLKIEEAKYDGKFFANIIEDGKEGFEELKLHGYVVNGDYFRTAKAITDINGVSIGDIVIGEKVEGENTFVNIVDNMTKSVTTVALGLVISILIFMF